MPRYSLHSARELRRVPVDVNTILSFEFLAITTAVSDMSEFARIMMFSTAVIVASGKLTGKGSGHR